MFLLAHSCILIVWPCAAGSRTSECFAGPIAGPLLILRTAFSAFTFWSPLHHVMIDLYFFSNLISVCSSNQKISAVNRLKTDQLALYANIDNPIGQHSAARPEGNTTAPELYGTNAHGPPRKESDVRRNCHVLISASLAARCSTVESPTEMTCIVLQAASVKRERECLMWLVWLRGHGKWRSWWMDHTISVGTSALPQSRRRHLEL